MKKQISILIVLALLVGLFAACGGTAASEEPVDESVVSEAQAEAAEEPEAEPEALDGSEASAEEEISSVEGPEAAEAIEEPAFEQAPENITYPLSPDDNAITFYQQLGQGIISVLPTYNGSYIDESVEAATGIDMQFIEVSDTVMAEQYSLMVASGDWADVISCDQYYSGGTTQAYADEVIMDLTDLVYDNCPNYYNKLYSTNEASIQNVTVDGRILGIYSIKDQVFTDSGEMTRADWLEAQELEVPTTLEELTNVLYTFKNAYDCSYTVKCDSNGVLEFVGAFDTELASLSGSDLAVFIEDGIVQSGYVSDGYREYVEWFAQLYADGIIHPDFYTSMLFPDVFNGLVGSGDMAFWNSMADGMGNIYAYTDDPNFAQVAVPTVVKEEGDVNTFVEEDVLAGGRGAGFSITTTCEKPELVLQFFNYFFTDEGSMLYNFGVEGDTYTLNADGTVSYTELITDNELGMTMNNALNYYTCVQVCPGYSQAASLWACYDDEAIAAMETWAPVGTSENVYPKGAALSTDDQDSVSNRVTDIISGASEQILKFMTGAEELNDESWNAYLADMDDLGMQDVLAVYQSTYDEYMTGER